jgi:ATP/ADP translocase
MLRQRLHFAAKLNLPIETTAKLMDAEAYQNLRGLYELEPLEAVNSDAEAPPGILDTIKVHKPASSRWSSWFSTPQSITLGAFLALSGEDKAPYYKKPGTQHTLDDLTLSGEEALRDHLKSARKLFALENLMPANSAVSSSSAYGKDLLSMLAQTEVETIHQYQAKAASNDKNMWKAFKSIIVPCESKDEFKRFLLLSALGFLAILAYSLLRVSKDTMILSVAGAEVLPVLKFAVVLPATFAATYIWKKLVERFGDKALFVALLIFAGFFTAFFFALPHLGILQGATWLSLLIPGGFGQAMQYWTYTLFYMMSELWAVVLVDGFLKSLQNQVLRKERLKEVLPTASLFQSVGLITSSLITSWAFGLTGYTLSAQVGIILVMLGSSIALIGGIYALAMYTGILKPAAAPNSSTDRKETIKAKLAKILDKEEEALKTINTALDSTEMPVDSTPCLQALGQYKMLGSENPQVQAILLEEGIEERIQKIMNDPKVNEDVKSFLLKEKRTTLSEKLGWLAGYKPKDNLQQAMRKAVEIAAAQQEGSNQKNKAALEEAAYKLMVLGYINTLLPSEERLSEKEALTYIGRDDEDTDAQKTALSADITYLAWYAKSSGLQTMISMYRFPLLRNVALCILGYNMSLVIFELVWKNQVKIYVNAGATAITYGQYMSMFNMWTGIITIGLCLLGPVISKIPTKYTNLITPGILVTLAVGFFGLLLFPGFMATLCPILFATSTQNHLAQIALLGLILNVSVKSTKYSTFEPGVAEANGVLPKVIKDAYQSTVNMINGKLGKAGASAIAIGLIIAAGTISAAATYIPIVLGVILTTWIFASLSMSQNVGILTGTANKPVDASEVKGKPLQEAPQTQPVQGWNLTACFGLGK